MEVFCLSCVISAWASRGSSYFRVLVSWPMKTFYKPTEILRRHGTLQYHKNSMADMVSFLDVMEQHTPSVIAMDILLMTNQLIELAFNCKIYFCGRLWGHRDDEKYLHNLAINPGNFQSLLDFHIELSDKVLKEDFQKCPRNTTYQSKTVQNETIKIIDEYILVKTLEKVQRLVFLVLGDEFSDISNE